MNGGCVGVTGVVENVGASARMTVRDKKRKLLEIASVSAEGESTLKSMVHNET